MPRFKSKTASLKPQLKKAAPRRPRSYTPLSDALKEPFTFADTELSAGIQRHSLVGLFSSAMGRKRRSDGEPLPNLLCALVSLSPIESQVSPLLLR